MYTIEFYSDAKNDEITWLAAPWMDLENIILSDVSQKKENTRSSHLYMVYKITG